MAFIISTSYAYVPYNIFRFYNNNPYGNGVGDEHLA
jgi:hypothetical protein